ALSRRDFLRGSGVAAAATALGQQTLAAAPAAEQQEKQPKKDDGPPAMGPGPVRLTLTVNDRKVQQNVEPRVTLLDALRDFMDVTGCKRVCDRGTCGACTVLIDGKPIYSCTMLALEAEGKAVRTAESLAQGDRLDPIPAAFVAADAQQCGFCTP